MPDRGPGLENGHLIRPALPGPDTDFRLLASHRFGPDPADVVPEEPNLVEDPAAEGHVCADDVAHGCGGRRLTAIRAADNPEELLREPSGRLRLPGGGNCSADGEDFLPVEGLNEVLQPVRAGNRVVVKESHDFARAGNDPAVART